MSVMGVIVYTVAAALLPAAAWVVYREFGRTRYG